MTKHEPVILLHTRGSVEVSRNQYANMRQAARAVAYGLYKVKFYGSQECIQVIKHLERDKRIKVGPDVFSITMA